jgi:beta-aspartyl-peptidase (threonine type)
MKAALLLLCSFLVFTLQAQTMENFAIAVHGGAGTLLKKNMTPEMEARYLNVLNEALQAGHDILKKGGTSLDAAEVAVRIMEDAPLFNAGKGAVFTSEGKNELDASVMEGKTLKAGAVAGVRRIKNPVTAARAVMEKTVHVMLTGEGAERFAKENGIELVDTSYFFEQHRWDQLQKLKEKENKNSGWVNPSEIEFSDKRFGTVGAVALDKHGTLAAATSTGGMMNKKYGRVGDTPIIGAGTYANNKTCAVSCTGHGEFFIRNVVAYDVSALMEYANMSLSEAANKVVMEKLKSQGGEGGLIAVDNKGNVTMPFNSEGMYRGYMKADGKKYVAIYKE